MQNPALSIAAALTGGGGSGGASSGGTDADSIALTAADTDPVGNVVISIGGPVLAMIIFLILGLMALRREKTSNFWAMLWMVLFGLAFASTPAGHAVVGWINTAFNWLAGLFGGASAS